MIDDSPIIIEQKGTSPILVTLPIRALRNEGDRVTVVYEPNTPLCSCGKPRAMLKTCYDLFQLKIGIAMGIVFVIGYAIGRILK